MPVNQYNRSSMFQCLFGFSFTPLLIQLLRRNLKVLLLNLFMVICFITYAFIHKQESFPYRYLIGGLLSTSINAYLMKKKDYSKIDINDCQEDTESIGALWAHQAYVGYYKNVLQSLKDRINVFEKENDVEFLIKKLIIVIPLSCDVGNLLTDKDENIKEYDNLPSLECDQGANINRQLKNPVYGIEILQKIVYIAAEYPSTLNTLWKIKDDIKEEKFKYHRDCFIKTLRFLVKDSPCVVVEYDDVNSQQSLCDFLLSELRKKENTTFQL